MEIPSPVPLSALQNILAKSKKIMEVAEEKKPIIQTNTENGFVENYSEPTRRATKFSEEMYSENDEKEMIFETPQMGSRDVTQVVDYTEEQVRASKLPDAIKEAMLKNRIPRLSSPPSNVTTEAIMKLTGAKPKINETKSVITNKTETHKNTRQITIGIDELNALIDKRVNEAISNLFAKTLTEQTIKRTINTLIKEGKMKK